MTSVLQDWVMELPLRYQGTLLTNVRGCDLAPKVPCDIDERYGCSTGESSAERGLSAFFRYCVLVPADEREVDVPGTWFKSEPPRVWKPSQFGHYPQHWYSHLMHAFEVVAYCHPTYDAADPYTPGLLDLPHQLSTCCVSFQAYVIYVRLVRNLHLTPETREMMHERLTEDRIEKGEVVS